MRVKEFLKYLNDNDVAEDTEIFLNKERVGSVTVKDNKLIFTVGNALELYYEYKDKMNVLNEMITDIKKDGVLEVSEIEAVNIASTLELGFDEVVNEFDKKGVEVNIL